MKIAIIGGGSTYTPELVEGLISDCEELNLEELTLFDINETRLQIVGSLVKRMVSKVADPFRITLTLDRKKAITDADFVITQIRVGGQEARHLDTLICLEEDLIGQETTGAVGFAKAMRTIPVLLDICEDIERYAPGAYLINFTNPAAIITEAILKHSPISAIGLCNVPFGIKANLAKELEVALEDVEIDYVGLNHLAWVRKVLVQGKDKTATALQKVQAKPANVPKLTIERDFHQALGMLTNSYLDYFYLEAEMIEDLKGQEKTRAKVVSELEETLLELFQDPKLAVKPKELEKRGGAHYSTVAISLIKDIHLNKNNVHIVNVKNNGAIQDLPLDAVIEAPALVNQKGATALTIGKLEPEIRGLIQHVKAYEELTIEAAVTKDYKKALLALATNPLVNSVNKAHRILNRFNEAHNLQLK